MWPASYASARCVGLRLAVKQHQPGIQVVGQHGQLEMIPVNVKATRWMRRQSSIIVSFLDQIRGSGPLVIEPHHRALECTELNLCVSVTVPLGAAPEIRIST